MEQIEIRKIDSRKDLRHFIAFANELYKGSQYYCPPLFWDEMFTFSERHNPSLEFCKFQLFGAYNSNGVMVGRICGIINPIANDHWSCKKVRFGWFDFIDDETVSKVLLDAVAQWGREHGMTTMNGPVGFTDFDHQGLLLEGFDYVSPMASLYNYPYYQRHFENYGLVKEVDWIEFLVTVPDELSERLLRLNDIASQRHHLHVVRGISKKDAIKRYGHQAMEVIDKAYSQLYNFQPLTQKQKDYYVNMYFPMINFDFVTLIVNEKDEVVGVGAGMPDITRVLQKIDGKLLPFGWATLLKALNAKRINHFNMLLIGIRPDYQNMGVNTMFFVDQLKSLKKYGVKTIETTAILETNKKNIANWMLFEHKIHKRRRAYIKEL